MALIECLSFRGETPPRPEGLSRYGVTKRKLYRCLVFASADFPRHYPLAETSSTLPGAGSTVISRYLAGISADPPQIHEVPNPSVDVDSWEG